MLSEDADFAEWEHGLPLALVGSGVEPVLRLRIEDLLRFILLRTHVPGERPSSLGIVCCRVVTVCGGKEQAVRP